MIKMSIMKVFIELHIIQCDLLLLQSVEVYKTSFKRTRCLIQHHDAIKGHDQELIYLVQLLLKCVLVLDAFKPIKVGLSTFKKLTSIKAL